MSTQMQKHIQSRTVDLTKSDSMTTGLDPNKLDSIINLGHICESILKRWLKPRKTLSLCFTRKTQPIP